jgi:hypothetical protein
MRGSRASQFRGMVAFALGRCAARGSRRGRGGRGVSSRRVSGSQAIRAKVSVPVLEPCEDDGRATSLPLLRGEEPTAEVPLRTAGLRDDSTWGVWMSLSSENAKRPGEHGARRPACKEALRQPCDSSHCPASAVRLLFSPVRGEAAEGGEEKRLQLASSRWLFLLAGTGPVPPPLRQHHLVSSSEGLVS